MDPVDNLTDLKIAVYEGMSCAWASHFEKRSKELGISIRELEEMIAKELDEIAEGIRKKVSVNDPT